MSRGAWRLRRGGLTIAERGEMFPAHVSALNGPFVILLQHQRADEAQGGRRVWKDLDDIVGLYGSPPAHANVLSVDEKSQIQALDRTPPGLPMKKGRAATMTRDHKRHGTPTLFAALDTLTGEVFAKTNSAIGARSSSAS